MSWERKRELIVGQPRTNLALACPPVMSTLFAKHAMEVFFFETGSLAFIVTQL